MFFFVAFVGDPALMQVRSSVPRQWEGRSPSLGNPGHAASKGEGQRRLLTLRRVSGVAGDAPLAAGVRGAGAAGRDCAAGSPAHLRIRGI